MPAKQIPTAIMYDFDGTLSPINMQEHEFIPKLGYKSSKDFWDEVKALAKEQYCCEILSYMHTMLREAKHKKIPINRKAIRKYGKGLELFPGVEGWFDRINSEAKKYNVKLEHYIISSGVKPLIEGTSIAKHFKRIYACDFIYDADGNPIAPGVAINYTSKTQYIFRINKGTLDQSDNRMINEYVPMNKRPTPIENMIFVGDGSTDIPAMKVTKSYGGLSIAVYNPKKNKVKDYAKKLVENGRANCAVAADYNPDKKLENIIMARIAEISATHNRNHMIERLN